MTDEGLQELCDVVATENTVLFKIQFDLEQFGVELGKRVVAESGLNRAI